MGILYHVSAVPGLRTLRPSQSSHQRPYVYAVDILSLGLLFGAKKDDFDFLLDVNSRGIPLVCECYPGAFERIYRGKSCSVYEVEQDGFQKGITGWEPEWVSEREARVLRESTVPDLYVRLLEEERNERLVIRRYSQEQEYKKMIAGHLVDRLIRFDLLERFDTVDERGQIYFRPLIDGAKALLDGHLLI